MRAMAEEEPGPYRVARRHLFLGGVGAVLLLVGVALLLGKAAGYARLLHDLRAADPRWLLLALAGEAVCFAGYIVSLRAVTRFEGGPRLALGDAAHLAFATLGAGRLFVGGGAGALAIDYWALRRAGAPKDEAAARVVALSLLPLAAVWTGTWLAALTLTPAEPARAPLHLTLPWLVGVPAVFAAARFYRAPRWHGRLGRLGARLGRWPATLDVGFSLVRRLVARPRANALALAAAALYWAGDAVCLWAGLRAFGVSIDPARLLLAYGTGSLASLLPLPFGGIGSADAAIAASVRAVGVPFAPALLGVLAYRLFSYWLPTVPGIAAFAALQPLGRRLVRNRHAR